ncbi:MAG: hypothetical protein ACXVEJ_06935 [Nocardioides sp.]
MPRALPLTLTTLLLLGTAGCGSDDVHRADAPARIVRSHHAAATPSPTATPWRTPAAASPTAAPRTGRAGHKTASLFHPVDPRPTTLGAHLLTAGAMPALADGTSWRVVGNGAEGPDGVGACQKTSLETIGAVSAVRRDYAGPGRVAASQVVARFADKVSAARAHGVLTAWRDDCAQRLASPRTSVGPIETVAVSRGLGETYRSELAARPSSPRTTTGFGIVWKGRFLSIVEISADPRTYPEGWSPARAAVRRISRTFGGA